jgi:glutamine amidotransferase
MTKPKKGQIAIVDYGLGNIFSIKQACKHVGGNPFITSSSKELMEAEAVILPGVGAFGDAMNSIIRLDLVSPLREMAASGKIIFGICLGMQLLMTESLEFGKHKGLDIVQGRVNRFEKPIKIKNRTLKIPHVAWSRILKNADTVDLWKRSPLEGLSDGEYMYFIHSYYVKPKNKEVVLSLSKYGNIEFCSSLQYGNVFGCQFHPERSGLSGLLIYQNIVSWMKKKLWS